MNVPKAKAQKGKAPTVDQLEKSWEDNVEPKKGECAHDKTQGEALYEGGTEELPSGPLVGSIHTCLDCKRVRHYDRDSKVMKDWAKP